MLMDPIEISNIIRRKKKKMLEAEPELVDTDSKLDVNPLDMEGIEMDAEMDHSLDVPEKIDSREHQPEGDDALEMGISSREAPRMARLRSMLASMSMGR